MLIPRPADSRQCAWVRGDEAICPVIIPMARAFCYFHSRCDCGGDRTSDFHEVSLGHRHWAFTGKRS